MSAGLTLVYVSAADVVISESGGSGDLSITNVQASDFTLDGSLSTGSQDISSISASGNVAISLILLVTSQVLPVAGGNITIDGAASTTADVSIGTFSATNVTVSLGAGSSDLKIGDDFTNNRVGGTFTLDATNFGGDVDITSLTASGAVTMSFGGVGNFSAGGVVNAGVSTIDLSNHVSWNNNSSLILRNILEYDTRC